MSGPWVHCKLHCTVFMLRVQFIYDATHVPDLFCSSAGGHEKYRKEVQSSSIRRRLCRLVMNEEQPGSAVDADSVVDG